MNLAIDIGNTRTKFGFFKKKKLEQKIIWQDWSLDDLKVLLDNQNVQNIICSTVKPVNRKMEFFFKEHGFYINLSHKTPLPIQNLYETPRTLGKDRLAAVVGASDLFPKENCLVIDAGTCITYDIIDAEGNYLGGNIAPGLEMRWKAMHHFTAKLPLANRVETLDTDIGKNTIKALEIGGALGCTLEMKGWVRHFQDQYKRINTILTGGDANYFAKRLKTKIFVDSNLVLMGLNKILSYNVAFL